MRARSIYNVAIVAAAAAWHGISLAQKAAYQQQRAVPVASLPHMAYIMYLLCIA